MAYKKKTNQQKLLAVGYPEMISDAEYQRLLPAIKLAYEEIPKSSNYSSYDYNSSESHTRKRQEDDTISIGSAFIWASSDDSSSPSDDSSCDTSSDSSCDCSCD